MAILGKLGLSPQILKFYGHSEVNNSQVMIIEWAERGNLRGLYEKKMQIANDICLSFLFSRSENVFHHGVRCENALKDLRVKLVCEGIALDEWNIQQISDHVLNGKREKILKWKFANPNEREIQLEIIKIIQDAWLHKPELRITLLKDGELDLDGLMSVLEISDFPEIDEIPEEFDDIAIIPFKDGIDMHKNKEYKSAWKCFKQHAELNNPIEKFW
ncbi:29040_t:CDS:2, partial [Gigaspora margarita]